MSHGRWGVERSEHTAGGRKALEEEGRARAGSPGQVVAREGTARSNPGYASQVNPETLALIREERPEQAPPISVSQE